jgi:hypothetical protein
MLSKSKLIIGLLTASFFIGVCGGDAYSQNKQVTPKVKSVTVTEEKNDKGSRKILKDSEKKYDVNGNLLDEINYKDGLFDNHTSYEYDAKNNKIKEIEFDKSGNPTKITEFKYDEYGLKIEKCVFDNKGTLKSKKIYKYTTF